jgi:hypothetical protein
MPTYSVEQCEMIPHTCLALVGLSFNAIHNCIRIAPLVLFYRVQFPITNLSRKQSLYHLPMSKYNFHECVKTILSY